MLVNLLHTVGVDAMQHVSLIDYASLSFPTNPEKEKRNAEMGFSLLYRGEPSQSPRSDWFFSSPLSLSYGGSVTSFSGILPTTTILAAGGKGRAINTGFFARPSHSPGKGRERN